MSELAELQRRVRDNVLAGRDADPAIAIGRPGLAIYANAYRARLTEALRSNYPVLRRVLGDDGFAELALRFIAAEPSPYRSIRWFGDRLPAFMAADAANLPHPALADLARLEWAISLVFDGPDAEPLAAEALAAVVPQDWPGLRLRLHPTLTVLELEWSVEPVWHTVSDDPDAETAAPEALPHAVRVWRRGLSPHWRSIGTQERRLLAALDGGADFASLCAAAAEVTGAEDAAVAVLDLVRSWIADGLLVGLD
jgi:hypothetical protein